MSFLVDMFKQKAPFLTKKTSAVKSEIHFHRRELTWQSIKGKFQNWQKLEICKLFIAQNYTENTNGDMPLTVENV